MKKGWIASVSFVFLLGLAGCGGNNNATGNDPDNNEGQVKTQNVNNGGNNEGQVKTRNVNNENGNDGQNLRVSDRAAQAVERMEGVDQAHVIIANNNAYVAVRLAENGNN